MRKALLWILGIGLVLASLGLAGYPFLSSYLNSRNLDSQVKAYLDSAERLDGEEYEEMLEAARAYNRSLVGNADPQDPFGGEDMASEDYASFLSVDGSPVLAVLEIPCIDVELPVFRGTGEDALQNGAGHLANSSLPVGGAGTHAVLTGHTGLSTKKLFSDVASMKEDDVFFIHVLGDTLAYQVDEISTVLPHETERLRIDPEQDYVTLVTCTPFGVNTHRLLVRGVRIPWEEAVESLEERTGESTWDAEYLKALLLGLAVMAAILALFALARLGMSAAGKKRGKQKRRSQKRRRQKRQ